MLHWEEYLCVDHGMDRRRWNEEIRGHLLTNG